MRLILLTVIAAIAIFPRLHAQVKQPAMQFEGSTPCSNLIRPLHKIAAEPDCKWNECGCVLVRWKLSLFTDATTGEPSSYSLNSANHFIVKENNTYSQPAKQTESKGKWTIVRGTKTNPNALIYRLNPDIPELSLDLLVLNGKLLHVLDREGRLMIGDEFQSYTLSRTP